MTVLSHSQDTIPAHEAAEFMQKSGKAAKHKEIVLEFISKNQGATGGEIGEGTGLGHIESQRRISDLKSAGMVEYRDKRKCKVKGSNMSKVYLTVRSASVMNVKYIGAFYE